MSNKDEYEKACRNCVNCYADGSGYSDWTWMDTEYKCFLGMNPSFPAEMLFKDDTIKGDEFALQCSKFKLSFAAMPTISPDGEVEAPGRFVEMLDLGNMVRTQSMQADKQ